MKYLPYFFVFLVLLVSVNAFDANILTYRSDYTSFETFQAEIIFDDKSKIQSVKQFSLQDFKISLEGELP